MAHSVAPQACVAALIALLVACGPRDAGAPDISVGDGWTREIAPGQTAAAAYVTVTNRGAGEDRLVDVAASIATAATLHSSSSEGGVARMRAITGGVAIPARSTVDLKPGGTHIMLTGLKQPLRAGQTVELILGFAKSGRRPVAVRVVPAAGVGDHHGMSM